MKSMNFDPDILHKNLFEMDHRFKWLKEIFQIEKK